MLKAFAKLSIVSASPQSGASGSQESKADVIQSFSLLSLVSAGSKDGVSKSKRVDNPATEIPLTWFLQPRKDGKIPTIFDTFCDIPPDNYSIIAVIFPHVTSKGDEHVAETIKVNISSKDFFSKSVAEREKVTFLADGFKNLKEQLAKIEPLLVGRYHIALTGVKETELAELRQQSPAERQESINKRFDSCDRRIQTGDGFEVQMKAAVLSPSVTEVARVPQLIV